MKIRIITDPAIPSDLRDHIQNRALLEYTHYIAAGNPPPSGAIWGGDRVCQNHKYEYHVYYTRSKVLIINITSNGILNENTENNG